MIGAIEHIFEQYEQGRVDRREAMVRVGMLIATLSAASRGVAAAEERPDSTFNARGLNHLAHCGNDNFVALFRGKEPGIDHYCYTIDDYDPGAVVARLEDAGFSPRRRENRVYFDDPDGLTVQLSGRRSSWPG